MPGMRMVARNLGVTPVTIDRAGHQLGAGEFGVVTDTDHVTKAALADGKIGQVDRPDSLADVDPGARTAFELLDEEVADVPTAAADGGSSDAPEGASESSAAKTTSAREKGRR